MRHPFMRAALGAAALVFALQQAGVRAGVDVVPGQTGNEPHNALVNPRNPAQVAVMQGCQVRISNNYGQTFPIVRNTTIAPCNGDPSTAFDAQGRLFVTHLSRQPELTVFAGQIADTTTAGTQNYTPIVVSVADGNADDKQWIVADANPSSP